MLPESPKNIFFKKRNSKLKKIKTIIDVDKKRTIEVLSMLPSK